MDSRLRRRPPGSSPPSASVGPQVVHSTAVATPGKQTPARAVRVVTDRFTASLKPVRYSAVYGPYRRKVAAVRCALVT